MNAPIPERPAGPVSIASSACLTGAEVRYDGSGARSSYPHDRLDGLLQLRPVCPEMGIGMGTPRPPIRLVGHLDAPRAVGVTEPDRDYTAELVEYAQDQVRTLRAAGIAGFVFMKNSPSCGMHRVKVYGDTGMAVRRGRGIFAAALLDAWPELPGEDCGRLFDAVLCENFVLRVFAYAHWLACEEEGLSPAALVTFHSRYKYLLMAHSIVAYKEAGRLLADLSGDWQSVAARYIRILSAGLARPASRGGHANVLSHLQGYFKNVLPSEARQELATLIEDYRTGQQPLLAVLALLRHHLSRYPEQYLACQVYLEPTPAAAGLRLTL